MNKLLFVLIIAAFVFTGCAPVSVKLTETPVTTTAPTGMPTETLAPTLTPAVTLTQKPFGDLVTVDFTQANPTWFLLDPATSQYSRIALPDVRWKDFLKEDNSTQHLYFYLETSEYSSQTGETTSTSGHILETDKTGAAIADYPLPENLGHSWKYATTSLAADGTMYIQIYDYNKAANPKDTTTFFTVLSFDGKDYTKVRSSQYSGAYYNDSQNDHSRLPDMQKLILGSLKLNDSFQYYLLDADTGTYTPLALKRQHVIESPVFTPDRKSIVYFAQNSDDFRLCAVLKNLTTLAENVLTCWDNPPSSGVLPYESAWSPDGRYFAVVFGTGNGTDNNYESHLVIVDTTNPSSRLYVLDAQLVGYLAWSPDSSSIAFTAELKSSDTAIYTMKRDGTELKKITGVVWNQQGLYYWIK